LTYNVVKLHYIDTTFFRAGGSGYFKVIIMFSWCQDFG